MTLDARPWLPAGALSAVDFVARVRNRANAWARRWFADACSVELACDEAKPAPLHTGEALTLTNSAGDVCIAIGRDDALKLAAAVMSAKSKRQYSPADTRVMLRLAQASIEDLLREIANFFGAPHAPGAECTLEDGRRFIQFALTANFLPPIWIYIDHGLAVATRTATISSKRATPILVSRSEAVAGQAIRVGARVGAGRLSLSELYSLGQGDVLKIDRHEGPLPLTINGKAKRGVLCEPYREGSTLKLRLIEEHPCP